MRFLALHQLMERKSILLLIGILVTVAIGGLVEIAPLFYLKSTVEKVEGMRPYTPLELSGRNIYVREGCYTCHSQMIRTLRDEVERYGHYSLAAESMYDRPFQWGSKRTGPDLARVGGKYSNEWHLEHLINPREVVVGSIMPGYAFLSETKLKYDNIGDHLKVNAILGVPYDEAMIREAKNDVLAQLDADSDGYEAFAARYPKAPVGNFDGNDKVVTEMDALIAYLQMLGTLVDFTVYDDQANLR